MRLGPASRHAVIGGHFRARLSVGLARVAQVDTVEPVSDAARALWVWDISDPQATVDFAVASGIGVLYAAVPPLLDSSTQLPQLTVLSKDAQAAGALKAEVAANN